MRVSLNVAPPGLGTAPSACSPLRAAAIRWVTREPVIGRKLPSDPNHRERPRGAA